LATDKHIGILLFEDVEELDALGPWEVHGCAVARRARVSRRAGTRPHLRDEAQLEWVRRQRATIPLMTSVCTGALVYAAAGLLSHRPATTHWRSLDTLADLGTLTASPRSPKYERSCDERA
jgi:transcriptional regulator GlxA family with amidase domain